MKRKKVILGCTGHRPDKLGDEDVYERVSPIQDWCRREFRKVLRKVKPDVVIVGLALGWDTWCALECVEQRVPFLGYVPFEGQESRWWGESKQQYYELLQKAALVKTICSPGYAPWKMQKRNEAMMDDCSIACSLWDGSAGGTGNCVFYADSIKRERINIDPRPGIAFVAQKEAEMAALIRANNGGHYRYHALRWKYVPPLKPKDGPLKLSRCPNGNPKHDAAPYSCDCIPF